MRERLRLSVIGRPAASRRAFGVSVDSDDFDGLARAALKLRARAAAWEGRASDCLDCAERDRRLAVAFEARAVSTRAAFDAGVEAARLELERRAAAVRARVEVDQAGPMDLDPTEADRNS